MANLHCDFRSDCLDMVTAMNVALPEKTDLSKVKVIYLLHGLQDNCSGWMRYTSVERYARKYNAALVIPEVQRSFYTDMVNGVDYFSYVAKELPEICRGFFGFSAEKEKNYIMGLSMGGYGALKCAFNNPDAYAGVAAFSAVTDMPGRVADADEKHMSEFRAIFGPELKVPHCGDLFALAEEADAAAFPKVLTCCGEQDDLFGQNERFAALLKTKGFDAEFRHWEGIHDWVFWDRAVNTAIDYMLG